MELQKTKREVCPDNLFLNLIYYDFLVILFHKKRFVLDITCELNSSLFRLINEQ